YLIETRLHLPVSASAPSVITAFRRPLTLRNALFIVISQSGRSPDLVAATQSARASGARTVAIVNAVPSPVANAAEFVIPIEAGPEHSVAATKTVVGSMAAGAELIAELADDMALKSALDRLPERLHRALTLDWSEISGDLASASAVFVTSRGLGLSSAREIALKLAEILRLPALSFSAAELQHGPRAALSSKTPVIVLRLMDETAAAQEPDAVAGGIRFVPLQLAVWNLDLGPDLDMRPPKRLIRPVVGYRDVGLSISDVDLVGPVCVGFAAAARRRNVWPHQR